MTLFRYGDNHLFQLHDDVCGSLFLFRQCRQPVVSGGKDIFIGRWRIQHVAEIVVTGILRQISCSPQRFAHTDIIGDHVSGRRYRRGWEGMKFALD